MALISLWPRSLAVFCLVSCFNNAGAAFLQRHIAEPGVVDGQFMRAIADAPGNALVLLYSPTCPDCEWLTEKVWKTVAAKLKGDPDVSVMTMADPGFAAPKPFEHWQNPAVFWAAKDHKTEPIFFPWPRIQEYLKGTAERPQEQQDSEFAEDLLVFAKGAVGIRLFNASVHVDAKEDKALRDVDDVADKGWAVLQGKWADKNYQAAQNQPAVDKAAAAAPKAATASLVVSAQAVQTHAVQDPHQLSMAYAEQFVKTHAGKGYTVKGVYKYALPYYEKKHAALIASAQAVKTSVMQQHARKLAMAYAEEFVRTNAGKGYTVDGVYKYALPYYEKKM